LLRSLSVALHLVSALLAAPASAEVRFEGLGSDPVTGVRATVAYDVSADGAVVVGRAEGLLNGEAFRWTRESGVRALGDLPGGELSSTARAVSGDGSVVVGEGASASGVEAFLWTAATGMVGLGDIPGGDFESRALDVSIDGNVVVGEAASGTGTSAAEAFRWTSDGGMQGLGRLLGDRVSSATAVSHDGSTVAGLSGGGSFEAFRWTEASGLVGLGTFLGVSRVFSQAFGISGDGAVIVGDAVSPRGVDAFRWTEADGLVGLRDVLESQFTSIAQAASGDGAVIVGSAHLGSAIDGPNAFVWTARDGMQRLDEVLADLGVDTDGWTLSLAFGVSADGTTIVGVGTNPDGLTEAWIAVLPARCTAAPDPACSETGAAEVAITDRGRGPALRWRATDFAGLDPASANGPLCLYTDEAHSGGALLPSRVQLRQTPGGLALGLAERGAALEIPALPLAPGAALRLELHDEAGGCVQSTFTDPSVNEAERYRAETR